jgi:peptidoglycan DL-endopeptidase CwlO
MVPRRTVAALVAAAMVALTCSASANASVANHILELCTEGKSIAGFTEKQYREALEQIEIQNIEYSECPEVIYEAERESASSPQHHGSSEPGSKTGGGGGGGSGGGESGGGGSSGEAPFEPTAEEQHAIEQAQVRSPGPIAVGGSGAEPIHPGVVHANVDSALNSLPTPLLAVLAALLALIVSVTGIEAQRRMKLAEEEP